MFPDLNQILKHLNGRLDLFSIIKFLYLKKRKTMTRARGVLMGVIPKYQGLGIESAFILNLRKVFDRKPHYTEIEFSWVGDFNPKMRKIFISVGSVPVKNYITYRYLFDRTKEFKRYPIPEIKELDQMKYDIIIIGAGLGGLTAGAKLAREGKKVLLIEQHNRAGRLCNNFQTR